MDEPFDVRLIEKWVARFLLEGLQRCDQSLLCLRMLRVFGGQLFDRTVGAMALAASMAERVSAVSPDWEIVTSSVPGCCTRLR